MLVLSRKTGETIRIGAGLNLVVLDVSRGRVKLGFEGSRDVPVRRGELAEPLAATTAESPIDTRLAPAAERAPIPAFPPLRVFRRVGGI